MVSVIQSSPDFGEVLFLIAAVVGAVGTILALTRRAFELALLAAAVTLVAWGLLAV